MADEEDTRIPQAPFAAFRERLGLNLKEVAKAGALIGIEPTTARARHSGIAQPGRASGELSLTERLAMSAVAAGLPPYRPELHHSLAAFQVIIGTHAELRAIFLAELSHNSAQQQLADTTAPAVAE